MAIKLFFSHEVKIFFMKRYFFFAFKMEQHAFTLKMDASKIANYF